MPKRKSGDDEFRRLVEENSRGLIALAYRYVGDWETARDITQDTWITVHQQWRRYDPSRPLLPWLRQIQRNACVSWLRRASLRRELPAAATPADRPDPSPAADAEHGVTRRELAEAMRRALGRLTESQRRVFALVDLEQVDQREAASRLGLTFATLRSTLHFARRRLAARLRELEER
jgi:RNA polymerase sigma-70 factor (ECF subfamily)